MAKEILLYAPILNVTAESFINQLNDANGESVTCRVNCPGGSVFAGWGMVAKSLEYEGDFNIKVDGNASSMAAIFLLFHKNVEALDTSVFMLHRADIKSSNEQDLKMLADINASIRKAFESKIDVAKFEAISGVTLDEFFNSDTQIDVNLNAMEAKEIGLISKINVLEPAEYQALNEKFASFAAFQGSEEKEKTNNNKNKIKMTVEQLKAEHPGVYAQVFSAGSESGIKAERERSSAFLAFMEADTEAVVSAIKDGSEFNNSVMADMTAKLVSAQRLKDIEANNAENVDADKPNADEGEEPTAVSELDKLINERFKIGE